MTFSKNQFIASCILSEWQTKYKNLHAYYMNNSAALYLNLGKKFLHFRVLYLTITQTALRRSYLFKVIVHANFDQIL
jgi:hypothetical protein